MTGATFTVEIDDTAAIARLGELFKRMDRPEGFFRQAAEYIKDIAIVENFKNERSPDGTPWASLTPATIKRRERLGQSPIRILRASGSATALSALTSEVTASEARVGSGAIHAAVHQFGAAKGAFGTDSRGRSLPWGDIPARPFLGLSEKDEAELVHIAETWLAGE